MCVSSVIMSFLSIYRSRNMSNLERSMDKKKDLIEDHSIKVALGKISISD